MTMDDQSQIRIPESFMALYLRNGRPTDSRAHIEARYDLCEDMAIQTSELCHVLQFREDLTENEVLRRVLASLRQTDGVSDAEAEWAVTRVAELLQWPRLADGGDGDGDGVG